jgi:hypothetical protein
MKAVKLININGTDSAFLLGQIKEHVLISAHHFLLQSDVEKYELTLHPAPRCQFVITLKGKLRFTVTNGDSFMIEPGIILIADDLESKGHTWQLTDGDEWHRIYIIPSANSEDYFTE